MDYFLGKYKLPDLIQEELENLNRPTILGEIAKFVQNLSIKKALGPYCFTPLTF